MPSVFSRICSTLERTALARSSDQRGRVGCAVRKGEDEDVGLRSREVDGHASARGQTLGDEPRVRVVFDKPLHVPVECVQTSGREDAHLTHRAAGHPPIAHGPLDQLARSGQKRSTRRSQSLRKRDRHQIERSCELRQRPLAGRRGVPEPRSVEEAGHAKLACRGADA